MQGGAVADGEFDQRQRRPRTVLVAAAVIVAVVVALGVWLVVSGGGDSGTEATPPTGRSTSDAGTPSEGSAGNGSCSGVAGESSRLPTKPPADLDYEVENGAVIPVSDRYGPADRSGPVWTCFSHSPMGAVMAAESISTRRLASRDRVQVGEEQLVDNEGRRIFLEAARARDPDELTAEPGTFVQPAGFRVESYNPETAVIASVSRSKTGQLRVATLTVVWQDKTWKLQLLPDGGDTAALTPVADLDGFVRWGL
jgi:hypothetical protein